MTAPPARWGRLRRAASDPMDAWRTARSRYLHWLFLDVDRRSDHTVFVAGSARSGTTWLADIINHDNDYRYVFEPFRPNRLGLGQRFAPRQYLRPQDADPGALAVAGRVMTGRIRGQWTDQMNRKLVARRRVVKDVWANLLLGWIHEHFPQIPIVLILRHPCAVVSSQLLLLDWEWQVDVEALLGQPDLVQDHLRPYVEAMVAASTPYERHLVTWCVENLVPLRQFQPGQIHLVFYEQLCAEPLREADRLFRFLGKRIDHRILPMMSRPSRASRGHSAVISGQGAVDAWVSRVSRHDLDGAVRTLGLFGLEHVYGMDPVPNTADPESLLGRYGSLRP
jgi:hypothetical protein